MTTAPAPSSAMWPLQLVVLAVIWGSSFMLIKLALESFAPLQVSAGRIVIGTVTLLLVLAIKRQRLPAPGRIWLHAVVIGTLMNVIPFSLFAWGETKLSSIEAGIWNATTPLMAAVAVYLVFREERATARGITGLLVGFAGVLVVLAPWLGLGGGELAGHLALAGAAACYGVGTPYMRRHFGGRPEGVVSLSAAQLLCASAIIVAATLLVDGLPDTAPTAVAAWSVVALGAFGTGIAYVLFTSVIRAAGATTAASVTYLMPIVSTALGVVVLGEALGWHEPVGAVIILAGVAFASTRRGVSQRPAR